MSRHKRLFVGLIAAIAASCAAIPVAPAAAVTFNPAGDKITMAGTNISFSWGTAKITCEKGFMTGTLPAPAASTVVLSNPSLIDGGIVNVCSSSGMEGAKFNVTSTSGEAVTDKFRLTALSATSAQLEFPGNPYGIEFSSGACKIKLFKADIPTGVWTNGKDLGAFSTFVITNGVVAVQNYFEITANCSPAIVKAFQETGAYGKMNATFSVRNTTHTEKAVIVK